MDHVTAGGAESGRRGVGLPPFARLLTPVAPAPAPLPLVWRSPARRPSLPIFDVLPALGFFFGGVGVLLVAVVVLSLFGVSP